MAATPLDRQSTSPRVPLAEGIASKSLNYNPVTAFTSFGIIVVLMVRNGSVIVDPRHSRFGNHGLNTIILTPADHFRAILTEQTLFSLPLWK
ncbi:hypothetical protein TNCV_1413911 [Trichonephila clavipes]|nr:hypothetical protein TNCV_1413911 [Trichonephila clavipes]